MTIKITSLERSIVDILDRPDLGGGWEEVWRSLDNVTLFDVNKIIIPFETNRSIINHTLQL